MQDQTYQAKKLRSLSRKKKNLLSYQRQVWSPELLEMIGLYGVSASVLLRCVSQSWHDCVAQHLFHIHLSFLLLGVCVHPLIPQSVHQSFPLVRHSIHPSTRSTIRPSVRSSLLS